MIWMLIATALALPTVDLDGDGKPETITVTETEVKAGPYTFPCGDGESCKADPCDVVDGDKRQELIVCVYGMREDAYCDLWAVRDGRPVRLVFEGDRHPPEILTSGNGIVRTQHWEDRVYHRIEKYVLDGTTLQRTPQPAYYANVSLHVDRTFAIQLSATDATVVAHVRPDSDVTLVLESATADDWYLVRVSSGLLGWVKLETLVGASDHLQAVMGAG